MLSDWFSVIQISDKQWSVSLSVFEENVEILS